MHTLKEHNGINFLQRDGIQLVCPHATALMVPDQQNMQGFRIDRPTCGSWCPHFDKSGMGSTVKLHCEATPREIKIESNTTLKI